MYLLKTSQHVHQATHRSGGTLDLLVTPMQKQIRNLDISPPYLLADHALILFEIPLTRGQVRATSCSLTSVCHTEYCV